MAQLTPRELAIKNKLYSQYKQNKNEFIKDYGSDAERVMLGRAIKLAKSMAAKDDKQKIKEMIKKALQGPISETEEINSIEFIQNRKPVESNPEDIVKLDVPLLIRMLEYAREDAKTDMDLHFAAENMIQLSKANRILNMGDYESIVSPYVKID
jgi:hypothetical protein